MIPFRREDVEKEWQKTKPISFSGMSFNHALTLKLSIFWYLSHRYHCVKRVQIRSFFCSVFLHVRTEYSGFSCCSGDYEIRLSHIFETGSILNEKPSISTENPGFRSKYYVFRIKYFEILDFSHLQFEILGISCEIPSISKKMWNPGLLVDSMCLL